MQTSQPRLTAATDFAALDLLRAAAAFTVMLYHCRNLYWPDYSQITNPSKAAFAFFAATRVGHEAVMVFFVLSGFLVGGRLIQRVRDRSFSVGDYANDRATRILMPLIPAVLLTVAASIYSGQAITLGQVLANMVGLNSVLAPTLSVNAPLWSLPFEIHFYIMAGAAAYLLMGGRRVLLAAGALAWTTIAFCQMGAVHYALFWWAGAASVMLLDIRRSALIGIPGLAVTLAGVALYQISLDSRSVDIAFHVSPAVAEGLICLGLCAAMPWLCGPVSRWMAPAARPLAFIASFSYSLYLVHQPMIVFMQKGRPQPLTVDLHSVSVFLSHAAVCVAVALAFSFAFERQTPRLRRWIRTLARPRAKAAEAAA